MLSIALWGLLPFLLFSHTSIHSEKVANIPYILETRRTVDGVSSTSPFTFTSPSFPLVTLEPASLLSPYYCLLQASSSCASIVVLDAPSYSTWVRKLK